MASLLILLDDIATVLDDVAVLTKLTAKKASGVLGDDLALNAQQVTGVDPSRELPVVWAVAKGSLLNKLILVPLALLLNAFMPGLVTPLLMLGGAFLCYEGAEKVLHHLFHVRTVEEQRPMLRHVDLTDEQVLAMEQSKIKGAIKTDFILSAEIIVITLGVAKDAPFWTQLITLSIVALFMTIFVYSLVGGIVKLDDLGLRWEQSQRMGLQRLGAGILRVAPWLMKALSVFGTAAMFLVGGDILSHGLPFMHGVSEWVRANLGGWIGGMFLSLLTGLVVGVVLVGVINLLKKLWPSGQKAH